MGISAARTSFLPGRRRRTSNSARPLGALPFHLQSWIASHADLAGASDFKSAGRPCTVVLLDVVVALPRTGAGGLEVDASVLASPVNYALDSGGEIAAAESKMLLSGRHPVRDLGHAPGAVGPTQLLLPLVLVDQTDWSSGQELEFQLEADRPLTRALYRATTEAGQRSVRLSQRWLETTTPQDRFGIVVLEKVIVAWRSRDWSTSGIIMDRADVELRLG